MPTEYSKLSIKGFMLLVYTDQIKIKRIVYQSQSMISTTGTNTIVVYMAISFENRNNKIQKRQLVIFDDRDKMFKNNQLNYIIKKCKQNQ